MRIEELLVAGLHQQGGTDIAVTALLFVLSGIVVWEAMQRLLGGHGQAGCQPQGQWEHGQPTKQ